MDLVVSFVNIVLVNVLAWITPGPNMFAVIAVSLQYGRRHGISTGLGLACGAFVWATFAILGVAILFQLFPRAVLTLKLAGAGYLIWLGLKSLKGGFDQSGGLDFKPTQVHRLRKSFFTGLTVSMTNPKAALFFGSVMTAFIPATAPGWYLGLIVVLCGLLAVAFHSVTATLFSARMAINLFERFRSLISLVFGAVFIAFGGSIVYAVLRRS